MTVRWLTAFLDVPDQRFRAGADFWLEVTASTLSPTRGTRDEFATLVPADGDAYLRVQRVADPHGGCHLDLHVDDRPATARHAETLGASVERVLDDVIVMRSPAGLAFCVVGHHRESVRPAPTTLDGERSLVDVLCVDIPPDDYERETTFWAGLTGWELRGVDYPEYSYLAAPAGMPLLLLLQRLHEAAPGRTAGAHLDIATDDPEALAAAHERRGARVLRRHDRWITMTDPSGLPYCLVRRAPETERLT